MIFHLTIGSGKTTILRIITGKIQPTTGRVDIGETVQFGYNSQQRDTALNDEKMVWREIVGDRSDVVINQITRESMSARAYVAQFNFRGVDQQKLIGSLSGGERNRVHLAKSLVDGCNVLLLDEPTAALDPRSADVVMRTADKLIKEFGLTAVLVTHNLKDAFNYGNRIIQMAEGKVIKDLSGQKREVLKQNDLFDWFG